MNARGQAMVETMIIIVLLTMMVFAAQEISLMTVNSLISGETAFSVGRVAVVTPEKNLRSTTQKAALFLLARQISLKHSAYIPYDLPIDKKQAGFDETGNDVYVYNAGIKYVSSIMFGSLLSGTRTYAIGSTRMLKGYASCRLIKSPAEEYYERAYPDARKFK